MRNMLLDGAVKEMQPAVQRLPARPLSAPSPLRFGAMPEQGELPTATDRPGAHRPMSLVRGRSIAGVLSKGFVRIV